MESPDFEILIVGYAWEEGDVTIVDLANGEELPKEFVEALYDPNVRKHAHNAVFERQAFKRIGLDIPATYWYCTAVKAAYCGLPFALDKVSKVLDLKDKKLETGKALIRYFSMPCKPTKINGGRTRNYPWHAPEQWEMYKEYNVYDVLSEREIYYRLQAYEIPEFERSLYVLDQQINDRGILIDMELAQSAITMSETCSTAMLQESQEISKLENPNSVAQLKTWYVNNYAKKVQENLTEKDIKFLNSGESIQALYNPLDQSMCADAIRVLLKLDSVKRYPELTKVLENRQKLGMASIKKYTAMTNCAMSDNRVRGSFQFYGANRTGRWAGRLVQLQNLSKNHFENIDLPRDLVREGDIDTLEMLYDNIPDVLSQLVRTAFIAPEGKIYCVADFSAIEARVISWLAQEEWRLDVFRGDGKIYEATASQMFGIPISAITKDSDYRKKGKVSELALGFGGSLGAMKRMGGEAMGLSDVEMMHCVRAWRNVNSKIVELWSELETCAFEAVRYHRKVIGTPQNLVFDCDGEYFTIQLPSGRKLFYNKPLIKEKQVNRRVTPVLYYTGMNQETKVWAQVDTYGGKMTENIVQATARDLLGYAMLNLSKNNFDITMHVHDEAIAEIPDDGRAKEWLQKMVQIMCIAPEWASDIPLNAAGFTSKYYKKD
jgi:DNA polymerase